MSDHGITYDHARFHPNEENLKKVSRSMSEAEGQEKHEIRCPVCGFLKGYVIGEKKGTISLKCQKCSFDGAMNLAYFRRLKAYRIRFEPERYGPDK